jgi:glycosyltransferase involved in cell wall biosynthesis
MWGQVQTLKRLGFGVDLAVTVKTMPLEKDIRAVSSQVDTLMIVERHSGLRAAVSVDPFQVRSRDGLLTLPFSGEYQAVVLMAEHVAAVLDNPSLRTKKCILRLHNNETRFFQELSKSSKSWFQKLFYQSEAAKFRIFSPRLMAQSHALWFISDYERKEHVRRHPEDSAKAVFVPPLVDFNSMCSQPLQGYSVLFLGTLALANNVSAIEWYASKVHSSLCDLADYRFVIAGNTRGGSIRRVTNIVRRHPNMVLYENPSSTHELYREAAVFVNPVFRGAGLKMKTIEAIQAGVPVVTTSIGIEGTGLAHRKHLLIADTACDFARSIRTLFHDRAMAAELVASAQNFLKQEFDQPRIIDSSLSAVL